MLKTTNNKKQLEHSSRTTLAITPGRHLCRFGLSIAFCTMLVSAAGAVPAQSPQDVNSPQTADETLNVTGRQVWHSRIDMPAMRTNQASNDQLQRLIEQVRSVKLDFTSQVYETNDATAQTEEIDPNQISAEETVTPEPSETQPKADPSPMKISAQTLEMLKELSAHPEQVRNPAQLGEVLFQSGNLQEAATFYSQALKQKPAGDLWAAENRAWIQLQTANCLRSVDLAKARKTYRELIEEYPTSLWADLAKAQEKLLEWRLQNKLAELVGRDIFADTRQMNRDLFVDETKATVTTEYRQ